MSTVSVIIPVYNCAKYLPACVESIAKQSFSDIEILLVDDGSTDLSPALCDELAETDDRIRVFHKPNGGASSARNVGIKNADGRYLLFVDCDDTVDSGCIEGLLYALTASSADMVVFGMAFDYYSGEALKRTDKLHYGGECTLSIQDVGRNFAELFSTNSLSSACNKLFTRAIIDENTLRFDESMCLYEDFDFVLRYMAAAKSVTVLTDCWYHYRIFAEGNHFKKRIANIDTLINGVTALCRSANEFDEATSGASAASIVMRLGLQLLYRHFISDGNTLAALRAKCVRYMASVPTARSDTLDKTEKKLLAFIQTESYFSMYLWLQTKKIVRFIKGTVKKILRV